MSRLFFFLLLTLLPSLFFCSSSFAAWPGDCGWILKSKDIGCNINGVYTGSYTNVLSSVSLDGDGNFQTTPGSAGSVCYANGASLQARYYEGGEKKYAGSFSYGSTLSAYPGAFEVNADVPVVSSDPEDCGDDPCADVDPKPEEQCNGSENVIWDDVDTCKFHCENCDEAYQTAKQQCEYPKKHTKH
ncbi:MAG: hypothetical protein D3923_16475, partial [Candidatus Electrothrix sp. AR3]|nr:hypothetical protein [Candidatus Electrothrix sp. AR3]